MSRSAAPLDTSFVLALENRFPSSRLDLYRA